MESALYYGLAGSASGAIVGLLAIGLVIVYRGTNVLNFAQVSLATVGAYAYLDFANRGLPLGVALAAGVAVAGVIGVAIEIVVMRPLAASSSLTRIIASGGTLLVLQAVLFLRYGAGPKNVPSLLPTTRIDLWSDRQIGVDRIFIVLIALAVALAIWSLYKFTNFGVVTAAVAENQVSASALGHSPTRYAIANWFVGGSLAGLAGALIAPVSGLNLELFLPLLMAVFAASLAGGLSSIPLTMAGGLAIGIIQSLTISRTDISGGAAIATFGLLVLVMLLRGGAVPSRSSGGVRLPSLGTGRINPLAVLLSLVAATGLIWFVLPANWNQAVLTSMLVAIPMLSVVVITGYAGQVSFAQFAIAGLGAVTATRLSQNYELPFVVLLLAGGLVALPAGYALSLAARTMRGASFAIITFGFNVLLYQTLFSSSDVETVPPASLFGIDLTSIVDPRRYLLVTLAVFVLLALAVANIRRSRTGRIFIAMRANERAAASVGIHVNGAKTSAFLISSFIAGVGGVLIALRSTAVVYSNFDTLSSVNQLGWTVIGGVGFIVGPLLGMGFVSGGIGNELVNSLYTDQFRYLPLVGAVVLVITILQNPDGIVAQVTKAVPRRRKTPTTPAVAEPAEARTVSASRDGSVLAVSNVDMAFGGVVVLKDVSIQVLPGQVHGLIGPNGAGKTTLLDVICGDVAPSRGSVRLGDDVLDGTPSWKRARAGVGRSFQSLELFEDLTVLDNIRVASDALLARNRAGNLAIDMVRPRLASLSPSGAEAIALLSLEGILDRQVRELTYGDRHLVAIARALATQSRVLLLDEPAAGLDLDELDHLRVLIRRIASEHGVGILLIEHDVGLVMEVSDWVTALDFGEVIAAGTPREVQSEPKVIHAYLGTARTEMEAR